MYFSFFCVIFRFGDEFSAEVVEYFLEKVRVICLEKVPTSGFCNIFEHDIIDVGTELFSFLIEKILAFPIVIEIRKDSSRRFAYADSVYGSFVIVEIFG